MEQLRQNIERIEAQAVAARRSLGAIVADAEEPAAAGRAAVNALSIRLVADLNGAIETWALWARREVSGWESTAPDWPGARAVFDEVVRRGRE